MEKLSAIKYFLIQLWLLIIEGARWIYYHVQRFFIWLAIKIPLIQRLSARHKRNRATLFLDSALSVLTLYLILAVISFIYIYPKRSEGEFARQTAYLFPFPAAKVSNTFIWSKDFLERVYYLNNFNEYQKSNPSANQSTEKPPTDKELREKVLEGLIEDRIVLLEARANKISVSVTEVNSAYEVQKKNQCFEKKEDGAQAARDCTDSEFAQIIKEIYKMEIVKFKEILAEALLKEKIKQNILVRIRVSHILISNQNTANDVKKQLDEGKSFNEAVVQFSEDAKTKDAQGDLGYWYKGDGLDKQIAPAFEQAAFSLEVNQISSPVQTQYGYHIITVTEKTGRELKTFPDWVKEQKTKYKISKYLGNE